SMAVKFSVTTSDGRALSPPLLLIDQPLTSVLVSFISMYPSGLSSSLLQKWIEQSLPSPAGLRPSEARIRLVEATSESLVMTISLTVAVHPSRSAPLATAELMPRLMPHWKLFTWIQSSWPELLTSPLMSPYCMKIGMALTPFLEGPPGLARRTPL